MFLHASVECTLHLQYNIITLSIVAMSLLGDCLDSFLQKSLICCCIQMSTTKNTINPYSMFFHKNNSDNNLKLFSWNMPSQLEEVVFWGQIMDKVQPDKFDSNLYKTFFMKKMAQILQISRIFFPDHQIFLIGSSKQLRVLLDLDSYIFLLSYMSVLQPNLTNFFFEWSPLWLHQKI